MSIKIALINNSLTPYRLHVHRRIAREMNGVELHSLFTHEISNSPWRLESDPEIRPLFFGQGEDSALQDRLGRQWHEWIKGGKILKWIRDNEIQAVVLAGYNDMGRVRIIRGCRKSGIACFLWGDSNIRDDTARGLKRALKKSFIPRVIRRCTGVMPCGRLGADYFARYGARAESTFFFPVEPDYEAVRTISPAIIQEVKERFQLLDGRQRILFAGRLVTAKRPDLVVEAFRAIASDRPDWDLVLLGDGPERIPLEQSIPDALKRRIFWTGFVSDTPTVLAFYRACHAFVLPSDFEPWGVVINEAAAADLPIVASDRVGAAYELVRDKENGRIFPAGNLDALVECLRDVTLPERTELYRGAAARVLSDWRREGDPVAGLRKALVFAGVLA